MRFVVNHLYNYIVITVEYSKHIFMFTIASFVCTQILVPKMRCSNIHTNFISLLLDVNWHISKTNLPFLHTYKYDTSKRDPYQTVLVIKKVSNNYVIAK